MSEHIQWPHVPAAEPETVGGGCECWVTPERTWFRYGGAIEPGSAVEWNPDCPQHRDVKLCESCLTNERDAPDGLCSDCAADHEADKAYEHQQERAREQADLDAAERAREDAWKDREWDE